MPFICWWQTKTSFYDEEEDLLLLWVILRVAMTRNWSHLRTAKTSHKENNHDSCINYYNKSMQKIPSSPMGRPSEKKAWKTNKELSQENVHCKIHAILQEKGRTNFLFVFKKRQKSLNPTQIASKIH